MKDTHCLRFVVPIMVLLLASSYFFIKNTLGYHPPEIFFIATESDEIHYRFIIAHPPKDGNELMKLILAHEKTLTLPKDEYYLTYFKETRLTPRHFDSSQYHDCEEPSCLDKGALIAGIYLFPYGDRKIYINTSYLNNEGLVCERITQYKEKITEYCTKPGDKKIIYYSYNRDDSTKNIFGL